MFIQILLTVWLLALIFFANKFRSQGRILQQRIFSIFLVVWGCLSIIYYDVWTYTSGQLEQNGNQWFLYLPPVFFSICAGLGTYYLMLTFGKFRAIDQAKFSKNQPAKSKQKRPERKKGKKK